MASSQVRNGGDDSVGKTGLYVKTKVKPQQKRKFMGFRKNFSSIGIAGAITLNIKPPFRRFM